MIKKNQRIKKYFIMWIKTQNNRELVNASSVKILKDGKKTYIIAVINGAGFWSSGNVIIGKYKSLDEAVLAFKDIETSIVNSDCIHVMNN